MAGDVEAAAKLLDDALLRQKSERRERRVIADARVAVLDGVVVMLVVDDPERHEERGNQFQPAAEMIDIAGFRERDQRLDGNGRSDLFERTELQRLLGRQPAAFQVPGEWKDVRLDSFTKQRGFGKKSRIATALFGNNCGERIHRA